MRRLYAFTTNLVSHLSAGFDRDGFKGTISELRLIFTEKTYPRIIKLKDGMIDKKNTPSKEGVHQVLLILIFPILVFYRER